ncbi:MAG: M56 family metallopeptidase [Gemmatimonadota bacterium]
MIDFMLRAVIVGSLATAAAWLFERALRNAGAGTRHAWTFALLATTTLPFLPRLFHTTSTLPVPVITVPGIVIAGAASESRTIDYALVAWITLALCVACFYLVAYARLLRARRQWMRAVVADHDVDISDRFGPAIFGFIAPRIVVPHWVRTVAPEEQRLIVRHEREHIAARDHLQLLLTIIATIAMPWNPFVWLQTRRLRFALEADCDQRVLASLPDRGRYATLLVDVGSRRSGLLLTPALAEHGNGLERRIRMIASSVIRNPWKAAALAVIGAAVTIVACESRLPQETPAPAEAGVAREMKRNPSDAGEPKQNRNVAYLIDRFYPPLLRDAGIGGVARVRVRVHASGQVDGHELVESSGHPALDQAAMRVLREMEHVPARSATGEAMNTVTEYRLVFAPRKSGEPKPAARELPRQTPVEAVSEVPSFTPYTVKPELANREEVGRALVRNYPPALRDAGVGGMALIWLLIDETGSVAKTMLKTTSGQSELDAAALELGRVMRFTPARDGEEPVKVWIALPIKFMTQ